MIIRWPKHILHGRQDHKEPYESDSCQACVLAYCKVCGGAEGSLPTDCPGERMPHELEDRVYAGDIDYTRRYGWE